jgi:hypothetical protein
VAKQNSEHHVFEGIYDYILLLNVPFVFKNFEKFMGEYSKVFGKHGTQLTDTSPTSTCMYEMSSYFNLNSLKSVKQIKNFEHSVFNDYNRKVCAG